MEGRRGQRVRGRDVQGRRCSAVLAGSPQHLHSEPDPGTHELGLIFSWFWGFTRRYLPPQHQLRSPQTATTHT